MPWPSVAMLQPSVHRPLGIAGRYDGNAGAIAISVDITLRDASLEQVAVLGFGVHAGSVGFLVPAGTDVAVHRHGAPPHQPKLGS